MIDSFSISIYANCRDKLEFSHVISPLKKEFDFFYMTRKILQNASRSILFQKERARERGMEKNRKKGNQACYKMFCAK